MGSLLVVDGSGVCRAPIVAYTLREQLATASWLSGVEVEVRGLEAQLDRTMCESAAARIGYSGSAIAYFGAYRTLPLTIADIACADLVLTAERAQRSAVVRMLPGTQASVFTWKEALVLAEVLDGRRRAGSAAAPADLAAVARALHSARGTVAMIEPPVRTGPFHWRRGADADPLTVSSGHAVDADHRRSTVESLQVATGFAAALRSLVSAEPMEQLVPMAPTRGRWLRRTA